MDQHSAGDLTTAQRDVLERWKAVATTHQTGEEFDFTQYDRTKQIRTAADEFVAEPSREGFKAMWDRMHAASQRGNAESILKKWDGSIDDVATLIESIRDADSYDDDWEDELGAHATMRELFGHLHIEDYPILNAAAESGLQFFGYDTPDNYTAGVAEFEAFLETYEDAVGHVTADAEHGITVPIRLEVDQLFNVIDKVDEASVEAESAAEAVDLYEAVLGTNSLGDDSATATLADIGTDPTPYWVNQSNQAELIDEYLRAKVDGIWHHELERIEQGDVIFHHFDDQLVGYSVATGEYEQYTFHGEEYHRVGVTLHRFDEAIAVDAGLKETLGEDRFRTETHYPLDSNDHFNQAYLSRLSDAAANYLLDLADVEPPNTDTSDPNPPSRPDGAGEIERQLTQNKQVVLYGPPGTGKTYEAKRFAEWWTDEQTETRTKAAQVRSVTFHPSFSYEDFLEGLTADATESGSVTYDVEDGVLKRIAEDAASAKASTPDDASAPPFVLIVDEINRGNLAQIFGEVITLLEADKRETYEVELAHSGDAFTLPSNLYLIGTMNTADQSIALVDTALRRRFRFIDYPPDFGTVFDVYDSIESGASDLVRVPDGGISDRDRLLGASVLAIEELNDRILNAPQLGKGKQLGHTYLLGHESATSVVDAWRYDILPQLEEHYFGQTERLRQELLNGTGNTLFDWETERIQSFTAAELYTVLCQLGGVDDPAALTGEPVPAADDVTETEHSDAWATGERTPETFRERVEETLTPEDASKLLTILDAGEDVADLDAGRGKHNASVMVKADAVNPNVGLLRLKENGMIDFRWEWMLSNEHSRVSPKSVNDAVTVFEAVPGYEHDWGPDDDTFDSPTLSVQDLSKDDAETLADAVREFVERVAADE